MNGHKRKNTIFGQAGAAITEAAIGLPLLLLLCVGLIDLGSMMLEYQRASRVVYEGLRFASVAKGLDTSSDSGYETIIFNHLSEISSIHGLENAVASVDVSDDRIITVEIYFDLGLPFPVPFLSDRGRVSASSSLLAEVDFAGGESPLRSIPTWYY